MSGMQGRKALRGLVPALAMVGALVLATGTQAQDIDKIAVLVPEQGTDYGWNQQGVDAAKQVGAAMNVEVISAEGLGYGDVRPTLRELAAEGADLMIAHASGYNTAGPEIAAETGVAVAVVDNPAAQVEGLVADYTVSGHEGAYLAGMLAATLTRSGTLGIVVSGEPPSLELPVRGLRARRPRRERGRGAALRRHRPRRLCGRGGRTPGHGVGDRCRCGHRLRPGRRLHLRHAPGGGDGAGHRRRQGALHRRDRRQDRDRQGASALVGGLEPGAGLHRDGRGPEERRRSAASELCHPARR